MFPIFWMAFDWKFIWNSYPVEALKIWSLNLVILFSWILVSPILVKDFSIYPELLCNLFEGWFIKGFRFHIVLYFFCLLVSFTKD